MYQLILISLILVGIIVFFVKFVRERCSLTVNCWFCNKNTRVPFAKRNEWFCANCDQFNGFNKEGDYSRPIPEQYNERLNFNKWNLCKGNKISLRRTWRTSNGLCRLCNSNQELKIKQLSLYVPLNEAMYDKEIDVFGKKLDDAYKLCGKCENVLQRALKTKSLLAGVGSDNTHSWSSSQKIHSTNSSNSVISTVLNIVAVGIYRVVNLAFLLCFICASVYIGAQSVTPICAYLMEYLLNLANDVRTSDGNIWAFYYYAKTIDRYNLTLFTVLVVQIILLGVVVRKRRTVPATVLFSLTVLIILTWPLHIRMLYRAILAIASSIYLVSYRLKSSDSNGNAANLFVASKSNVAVIAPCSNSIYYEPYMTAKPVSLPSSQISMHRYATRSQTIKSDITVCNKLGMLNIDDRVMPTAKRVRNLVDNHSGSYTNYVSSSQQYNHRRPLSAPKLRIGNSCGGSNSSSNSFNTRFRNCFSDSSTSSGYKSAIASPGSTVSSNVSDVDEFDSVSQAGTRSRTALHSESAFSTAFSHYPPITRQLPDTTMTANYCTIANNTNALLSPFSTAGAGSGYEFAFAKPQTNRNLLPLISSIFHMFILALSFFILGYCYNDLKT